MRILRSFLFVLAATGCKQFYEVDEACRDKVPGEKHANSTEDAVDALWRTNCYRRLVNVKSASFQKEIQASAENHASYMAENKVWLDPNYLLGQESPEKPGFTGVTLFDRLAHEDYPLEGQSLGYRELLWLVDTHSGAERVDDTFKEPYFREFFLQLSVIGVGFAEAVIPDSDLPAEFDYLQGERLTAAYFVVVHDYPAVEHATNPVIYPKKEQLDVPTGYVNYDPRDEIPDGVLLGYPITVTVASRTASGAFAVGGNPYGIALKGVQLLGPDGSIETQVFTPPAPPQLVLQYSAAVVPQQPLAVSSEYTFRATVAWDGASDKEVEVTFTTSAEETTLEDTQVARALCVPMGIGCGLPVAAIHDRPQRPL